MASESVQAEWLQNEMEAFTLFPENGSRVVKTFLGVQCEWGIRRGSLHSTDIFD